MRVLEIPTRFGPARARVQPAAGPVGALVLGHGAGGGIEAPDLVVGAAVAAELGLATVLIEQPYRVAGRRAPAPAPRLDLAWTEVIDHLRGEVISAGPLICGGRSLSARVACRTVEATGAAGVLCLAFPLHPPGKADDPGKSRLPELDAVAVPVLIVQGRSDPFGMPPLGPDREVVEVAGDHGLKADLDGVGAAIGDWLARVLELPPAA